MTVAPEPTFWAFSGYDTPINVDRLADAIKDEYQTMLDDAVDGVTSLRKARSRSTVQEPAA